MAFSFNTEPGEKLYVKVGLSAVSETGAKANLETEISDWNFERIKQEAQNTWKKQLDKIQVKGGTTDQKTIFYTALYHSLLSPNLYQDVDGKYRGMVRGSRNESSPIIRYFLYGIPLGVHILYILLLNKSAPMIL